MQGKGAALILLGGSLIEMLAAFVIAFHAGWALLSLIQDRKGDRARLLIAKGVLDALGFSVAGTLLKTLGLESWVEIRTFAFVFLLRTLLKQVFQWERSSINGRQASQG